VHTRELGFVCLQHKIKPKENNNMKEQRFRSTEIRLEDDGGDEGILVGYPVVFDAWSDDDGLNFRERVSPTAFARQTSGTPDSDNVMLLWNHDPNYPLARSDNGSLKLTADNHGVRMRAVLPRGVSYASDLHSLIKQGVVRSMSMGFICDEDEWGQMEENGSRVATRLIKSARLVDVSAVTFAAYQSTSIAARSLFPEGVPAEIRARFPNYKAPVFDGTIRAARRMNDLLLS